MTAVFPKAAPEAVDVAVIGGGFAGTIVAVQLARLATSPLRIVIFDRAGAFGRGAAYSPASDHCLLNVRAKSMGAFPDDEADFVRWLRATGYGSDDPDLGERFLPRKVYGAYLCDLLARATGSGCTIELRRADVRELAPTANGYLLGTSSSPDRLFAKTVVLAIGNLPPGGLGDATLSAAMATYARNPWDLLAQGSVDRDADVFVVGTGLSALDILLHLAAGGHRGQITMLSRHGRFPLAHPPVSSGDALTLGPILGTPIDVLRQLRVLVRDAVAAGRTWHEVIDALRPQANAIWQRWTLDEQRQFCRHLAPVWDVHRHRAPESTLAVRDALIVAGQLHVRRGRLLRVEPSGDGVRITYRDAERRVTTLSSADVLIDCTGPRRDIANSGEPLIEALFARKLAQPTRLGIGFAAAPDGSLLGMRYSSPLYALGTPLRGTLWESSAVREIRIHGRTIAEAILSRLSEVAAPRIALAGS